VSEARTTLETMAEHLPEGGLIVQLRGRGGAAGLLAVDQSLLAALLQARTTGRVTGTEVAARAPTQTDAILARGFFAAVLDSFADRLAGKREAAWAAGFKPRDRIADTGRLPFLMRDVPYRALDLRIDIAAGLRAGRALLILPQSPPAPRAEETDESDADAPAPSNAAPADPAPWQAAFGARVMDSEARLEAVLHRWEVPLSRLSDLKAGELLTFPRNATGAVRLVARDGTVPAEAWARSSCSMPAPKFFRSRSGKQARRTTNPTDAPAR